MTFISLRNESRFSLISDRITKLDSCHHIIIKWQIDDKILLNNDIWARFANNIFRNKGNVQMTARGAAHWKNKTCSYYYTIVENNYYSSNLAIKNFLVIFQLKTAGVKNVISCFDSWSFLVIKMYVCYAFNFVHY